MCGCLRVTATSPSDGFFSSGANRDSKRRVFSLSRTLRATILPENVSRARHTRDMLPCPTRPISSKRLVISVFATRLLPSKIFFRKSNAMPSGPVEDDSLDAIVDHAGNFGAQLRAGHDPVDKAVGQHEFAGLKPLGQLGFARRFDDARARKTDEGFGLGKNDIAQRSKTGGDAPHGG